jgi:hypothetical protein
VGTRKYKINFRCPNISCGILLLTACFLLLTCVTACGRRTDPVLVPSYDEKILKEDTDKNKKGEKEAGETLIKEKAAGTEEPGVARPDAPSEVAAVYTGRSIVLVWKEVLKQGVTSYRVYRSSGEGYVLAGETVSPAFTDRDIAKDKKYFYKITAVGRSESPASEEITVATRSE